MPNARTGDNLIVVSPAVLPDKPIAPNRILNVAFAGGLLVALGIAFLLDYFDQSIKTDEELTECLGLISIAHVAFVPAGKGKRPELVALDGQSPASEAYKALRTRLLFSTVNAVTDAAILAASADGTILVVEQGRTTFPALRHAKQLLDRVGAHTIGVAMNKVRSSAGSYAYEYGYYGTPPDQGAKLEPQHPYESEPQITVTG